MALRDVIYNGLGLTPQSGEEDDALNAIMQRLSAASGAIDGGRDESMTPGFGMLVQDMPKKPQQFPDSKSPSTSGWNPSLEPSGRPENSDIPRDMSVPQTAPIVRKSTAEPSGPPSEAAPRLSAPAQRTQVAQAAAPQAPAPDFMDRLGALARGYNTGGLIGGISDAFGSGLDRQVDAQNQIAQALVRQGVDPGVVAVAIKQPALLQQLVMAKFGQKAQPSFTVIGEDAMGKKQYGWVDPSTQKVTPVAQQPGVTSAPEIDPYVSGEDFLKQLPPGEATQVKAIVEGRLRPPPMGRKNPYWERLLQYAGQYEPGFDMTKFAARQATRTDFDKGKSAGNIKALNTVMGHLDSMDKAIDPLGNYTYFPGIMNPIKDAYRNNMGDTKYQEARANFRLAKGAVASELMKVFRETGGSVTEVKDWEEKIHENESPAGLKETIKSAMELIASRMTAVNDQWNRAMNVNRDPREILSPSARGIFDRIMHEKEGNAEEPKVKPEKKWRGMPDKPPADAKPDPDGFIRWPNPSYDARKPEDGDNPRMLKWKQP